MFKKKLFFTISLLALSSVSFAECNYPKKKFDIPSGKKATEAEMVETMGKVKQFQADLGVYRTCLDDELAKVSPELESYEEIQRMNAQKYNASVEDEQKNRASNTFQQFAISTGRYTVLQDGAFAICTGLPKTSLSYFANLNFSFAPITTSTP